MTVEEFVNRLERVKRAGKGWMARCPAHEDRLASLSIAEGDDGRVLLKCNSPPPVAAAPSRITRRQRGCPFPSSSP
jgi:hypothetical protein